MANSVNILREALDALKPRYPVLPFHLSTVRQEMKNLNGAALPDDEAAHMLEKLWRSDAKCGVEPVTRESWKFGNGRPEVLQGINPPLTG